MIALGAGGPIPFLIIACVVFIATGYAIAASARKRAKVSLNYRVDRYQLDCSEEIHGDASLLGVEVRR